MIFQSFAQSLICLAFEQTLKGSSTLSAIVSVAGVCRVFLQRKTFNKRTESEALVAACCGMLRHVAASLIGFLG